MSEQTRQWQALADQRGTSLADYLRQVLHTAPEQLSTVAAPLGLIPLAPADLVEHVRSLVGPPDFL